MLASTFMDMVLGLDIHFEMVPMPAPVPTPLPNPFVGMVFDPGGLLTGQAMSLAMALVTGTPPKGPVLINYMPATVCGTNAKNSLGVPHIIMPPGTAWAPMPKLPKPAIKGPPPPPGPPVAPEGDAISVFGSKTVQFMGSSAVRMGDKSMSCGEPVRLPSSTVLAIPKGLPVMVGGPPALSISDAIGALLKSKWIAGYLQDLISRMAPGRLRNILSKVACFVTGHPVDVASGRVLTDHVDFELPGPLPLKFERNYASSWANRAGPLGHGWSHTLDQAVWLERGKVVYLNAEGQEIEFDTFNFADHVIHQGESVWEPISRLTLKALAQRRFEITGPDGVAHEFAPVEGATGPRRWWSRLVRQTARDGAAIELSYDPAGNLAWVRDSAGRDVAFEHDRAGHLVAVKLPHPTEHGWLVHTRFAYDAAGDLIAATDPLGHSWRFAYKQHLLVQETNRNGLSFYFAYDGHGEDAYCVRTWGDGGIYDHVIDYDKVGKATYVTNSLGHTTTYKMNVVGCVVEVMDALGASTKYEYDERTLRKVKETNPVGGETKWEYDARGNCTKLTGPNGAEIGLEFNDRDLPVRAVDAVKGEWQWGYDHAGHMVGRSDPLGRTVRLQWHATGREGETKVREPAGSRVPERLQCVVDPAGRQTALDYDPQGNLASLENPDGAKRRWQYDHLGRCTLFVDANGMQRRWEYDPLGRVVRIKEPNGNVQEVAHDPEGNVISAKDKQHDIRCTYSGMGRLRSRIEAGTTLEFSYDTEENLTAITNESRCTYRFHLGPTGQVDAEVDFGGMQRRYVRDRAGRVTKVLCPDNRTTAYSYDEAGRLVGITYWSGEEEKFSYRIDGELVEATNEITSVKFERDLLGRIIREVTGEDWVSSEYDALGARVRIKSSKGFEQDITRDSMSRAVGLRATWRSEARGTDFTESGNIGSGSWEARVDRDLMGREIGRRLPGGVQARWERDPFGRPMRQEISANTTFGYVRQYAWEANDRLRMVVDAARGPIRYEHDPLGRLAAATYENGRLDLRMPDAIGNLFRTRDRSDRTYGSGGQLLEVRRDDGGVTNYEYDAEGYLARRVEKGAGADSDAGRIWTFAWTGSGRLKKVLRPDGQTVTFAYDAIARRTLKTIGAETTRFVWDGDVPLHEYTEGVDPGPLRLESDRGIRRRGSRGAPVTWLFDPERFSPAAKLVGAEGYAIITDHIGTPTAMYDSGGHSVWSFTPDIYGTARDQSSDPIGCPFGWAGQYEDREAGLAYNRYRYYDPNGVFISPDPLGLSGGLRAYGHVPDPLVWIDPLGLSCKTEARENLREMGLENVELAGKSFNSGRKSLEEAGFIWMETTETGRQIFEHPETGARVTFDSGAALVPGQSPHWEMSDRGGTRYDRSGRPVVGPSPIMGGKHIPAG